MQKKADKWRNREKRCREAEQQSSGETKKQRKEEAEKCMEKQSSGEVKQRSREAENQRA